LAHADAVRHDTGRLGLVGPSDVAAVIARHTADSMLFALVREPQEGERWVDVGTGAGFPGFPLACAYPGTQFTLVEPQRRRAGFLELQCARLGIANAKVAAVKAGALGGGFDVATARALAEPALALEALARLVGPGGTAIVAVGEKAAQLPGSDELWVARAGVDSPGRFFMIAPSVEGA
jgi:16S rRNA (guanine527-N7)-methyltransferase